VGFTGTATSFDVAGCSHERRWKNDAMEQGMSASATVWINEVVVMRRS